MTTKKSQLLLLFMICNILLPAQDNIFGYYDGLQIGGPVQLPGGPVGLQLISLNSESGNANLVNHSLTGKAIKYIGSNKDNFLYDAQPVSTDNFNILSYNTSSNFNAIVAKTNWNLGGTIFNDTRVEGMAIDNNGRGWAVGNSVIDGNNYAATFQSNNSGGASDFSQSSFLLRTDLASTLVTDLAFDRFNNLFALVLDQINGYQYIYYAPTKQLAPAGATVRLSKLWQLTDADNTPTQYNPKYYTALPSNFPEFSSYLAEGLAFDSKGNLLISVDKMVFNRYQGGIAGRVENWIYALSLHATVQVKRILVYGSPNNLNTLNFCEDLAGNYYPVFFPTKFGEINATISGAQLQVSWVTENERNNIRFDIATSKDGINFTNLERVNSKGVNGSSNDALTYTASYPLSKFAGNLSPGLFAVFILTIFVRLQRKRVWVLLLSSFFLLHVLACKKNKGNGGEVVTNEKIMVRITATDSKGATTVSKVVQAYRL